MISGERLLGRLLGRADEPVALADTPALRVHAGIQLRLDQHGHVLEQHGLAMAMGSGPPRLLIDYLVPGSTLALEGAPRDWQGQSLDLMFQVGGGPVVYTRGWVQPHGDDWLLQLLDISDVLMGQQQARSRELTHLLTTHMGEQLRHCGHGRLPAVVTDLLQQVAHHWHIPCVALALPDTTQAEWRIYSVYRQHDAPALWEVDQALGSTLDSFNGHAPQRFEALYGLNDKPRLSGLFGNTDGLLVPYNDHQGVSAWLLFGQYPASRHAPAMGDMDWLLVCAALAGPLLSRLRELQHVQQMERMEALQGLLGSGWWEWSASTRQLLLAPPLAASLLPDQPAHVPREVWLGLFHPADREELASRFNDLLSHDTPLLLCVRLHQPDSTRPVIWYRIQGQVLGGEGGPRVVGFMLDVSDMQNQQQQAAAAHARLDNLIASSPAVIYVQRYAEGALLPEFFSASLQPLLGWTREECTAATLIEWVHPDDRAQYFERTRRLLREGNVRSRYRLRDREGDYHWLLDEARLLRDDLGLPVEAVGLWLDITDATEAAELVKHSEERYRMLVEDSPAMICRYTPDLTLTFGNRPLANYLECAPEQLPGINLSGWLSPEQQRAFVQRLATLTPEFPVSTAEISLQLPGREHAWWVWSDRGVFDELGVLVEVQAVGRDNTEVRRSQQQLTQSAKMATLGEMATGLAHEINQPLNVMRMAIVNVLKRLSNGDVQIDYLQDKLNRLDTQVQRAARVVDHMRVFGRRSEIEQQVFNPAIAIDGTLSLLSDGLRGKGVEIRCEGLDCAVRVRGHVDQLEQVLINLLVNARDALLGQREKGPDFAPWIALGIETDPGHVRLWVHDNAGGIDPRLLERIFEPFFTTKPVGVGTGLGLSVSYGIIENMGGRLSVSNTEHGARFCIALPVVGDQSTS
ncbi:PAS domain-containing sensor histidine kinase [Pseudomonas lundensis]|uniref:histidine kinase n=1 Tax=Pseudomonas lundensis TaxID=86185 RepID=A0ABX4GJ32_9PSED|nr:PAS domain-containing sensor histidine kinase [Pseudomonas lundensis]NMZ55064.1 PAS domain-containing protein [Pseudomonas lundensis]OZY28844.1 PAS domain-containing sensor histidine kinase [Pseudomonas lundensis]OZY54139.1 PAS domain-containing sensor histidine kinase [Pseudomonas lundensis]QOF89979.1 PAS domain-containing protein [Pseudomonas lundensis]